MAGAPDGLLVAAPADNHAAEQAAVAHHRAAAAPDEQNMPARVDNAIEDDAGARTRTTIARHPGSPSPAVGCR
jgi:hypothetical protein